MSKIFTKTYRARYSEINANGQLDPAHCARTSSKPPTNGAKN